MNYTLIIINTATIAILTMLLILAYKLKNDISTCKKCPFKQSLNCWECRRKFNIEKNKYNTNG